MVREDRGTGMVEIRHTHNSRETTDRWFVVRKLLDKAKQVQNLQSVLLCGIMLRVCMYLSLPQFKPDVETTELALAFPLPADLKTVVLSKVSAVIPCACADTCIYLGARN